MSKLKADLERGETLGEKRIGLFGGTFNPIHLGHLRGAEEVREAFQLEQVIFIPASVPPHKTEEVAEASHRLEMVKLGTRGNQKFLTSDIELRRPGKSYSIDTIRYFRERHREALFFILGRDAFLEIETWKDFRDLFSLCSFIIMTRPGSKKISSLPRALAPFFRYDRQVSAWVHTSGNAIFFKEINFLDISSTKVRELVGNGGSIKYLVPPEVEAYIREHGLYQKMEA